MAIFDTLVHGTAATLPFPGEIADGSDRIQARARNCAKLVVLGDFRWQICAKFGKWPKSL